MSAILPLSRTKNFIEIRRSAAELLVIRQILAARFWSRTQTGGTAAAASSDNAAVIATFLISE